MDILFGGYVIIFVGDFQQLPPIGNIRLYENDGSPSTLIYDSISNDAILYESHCRAGEEEQNQIYQQIVSHF